MNLLLDTNVVIDYLGRKEPFFEDAANVVAAGFFGDAKLWVPGQSLNDAFYVLKRYLPPQTVQEAIHAFLDVATTVALSCADYDRATLLGWEDYEDCLVSLCAERARAHYIITRDQEGFNRSPIPAIPPKDWLKMMREDKGLEYGMVDLNELD